MKTENLIELLAQDAPVRSNLSHMLQQASIAAVLIVAIAFFSAHDLPFRIRRLRLLARRLTQDWDSEGGEVADDARERAREVVYSA